MSELSAPQPGSYLRTPWSEINADRERIIAEQKERGLRILQVRRVPGIPVIAIEDPFAGSPLHQIVELPYETAEEDSLVQTARDEHQELLEQYGPENIFVARSSLAVALRHGHLFPDEVFVFMVQTEPGRLSSGNTLSLIENPHAT